MKWRLPLLLILHLLQTVSADLAKAYGFYLTGEIDSAIVYYSKEKNESPGGIDATYGLINCYIAKNELNAALDLASETIAKIETPILYAKMAYIHARKNNKSDVVRIYDLSIKKILANSVETLDTTSMQNDIGEIISAAGYGFYDAGNYREAISWFAKGDSLYKNNLEFKQAIIIAQTAKNNNIMLSGAISGGFITYSKDAIYDKGDFYGISISSVFKYSFKIKGTYTHTDIHYNKFGIKYIDKLHASLIQYPYSLESKWADYPFITKNETSDLAFFTYEEKIVKDSNQNFQFDTIITPTMWEDDFYFSLHNYKSLIKNTELMIGTRFTRSNMLNTGHVSTFFLKHKTDLNLLSLGCMYYGTILDGNKVFQLSPSIGITKNKLSLQSTINAIKAVEKNIDSGIPSNWQLSTDIGAAASFQPVKLTIGVTLGDRVFLNSIEGELLHNVIAPFKYGLSGLIELNPWNSFFTLYYLFKISSYDSSVFDKINYSGYSSYVNMGGIFLQW